MCKATHYLGIQASRKSEKKGNNKQISREPVISEIREKRLRLRKSAWRAGEWNSKMMVAFHFLNEVMDIQTLNY